MTGIMKIRFRKNFRKYKFVFYVKINTIMKKEILITILLGIFFLQQLNAQINNVKDAFLNGSFYSVAL